MNMKIRMQTLGFAVVLFGLMSCFALASRNSAPPASSGASTDNPLIGIWEMTVTGKATYLYKYAISEGSWVANGDVDQGYLNYRFSPTTGAYVKNSDGSYSYRERGWTYTRGGVCNGTFESIGTFVLDASGKTFSGPGVFKIRDLAGNTVLEEELTVVATKVEV